MSAPDENVDEVLVAYLDGQLAADQSERLESQLASDPVVRERLQSLDRVWNALDTLPRSTASPAFTRSTVEMVAVSAARPAKPVDVGRSRFWLPAGLMASLVGVVLGGALTYAIAGAPQRRALNDLPASLHAAALENAGSIEFLVMLSDKAGTKLDPFSSDEVRSDARQWSAVAEMTPSDRLDWLNDLPAERLVEVNSSVDRFEDQNATKKRRIRELTQNLMASPRAVELQETALAYQAMVSRLPASQQAALRQMEPEQRLRTVQKQAGRLAREAATDLSDAQRAELRTAIESLVTSEGFREEIQRIKDRLPNGVRDEMRDRIARRHPQLVLFAVTRFVAKFDDWNPREGRRGDRLPPEMRDRLERFEEGVVKPMTDAWSRWADRIEAALPEPAQVAMREAAARGDGQRARLLERFLRNAAPEDLSDAFVDLPEDEMQTLLLAPRDRFVEELGKRGDGEPLFGFSGFGGPGLDGLGPGEPGFGRPGGPMRPDRLDRRGPPPRGRGERGPGPPR